MLTFNLKKQWFDKIKNGEKTHEYRVVKKYWQKRLNYYRRMLYLASIGEYANDGTDTLMHAECVCGYPPQCDYSKRIRIRIKSINIVWNGKTTDLAIDKPVYDIEFEVVKCK